MGRRAAWGRAALLVALVTILLSACDHVDDPGAGGDPGAWGTDPDFCDKWVAKNWECFQSGIEIWGGDTDELMGLCTGELGQDGFTECTIHGCDVDVDCTTYSECLDACPDDIGDCQGNSGWPCTCDSFSQTCDDGSNCLALPDLGNGFGHICTVSCADDGGTCPATDYSAEGACAISDGTNYWCMLVCTDSTECPSDQICGDTGRGFSVCLP
jgi:hypothetical protein